MQVPSTPAQLLMELKALTSSDAKRQFRKAILERDGACVYCGSREQHLTLDHIKPIVHGGKHDSSNLCAACRSCNLQKGSQHWLTWWVKQESFNLNNFSLILNRI
jgi:5-methylcytosine-specific restriction endonuclease McrA